MSYKRLRLLAVVIFFLNVVLLLSYTTKNRSATSFFSSLREHGKALGKGHSLTNGEADGAADQHKDITSDAAKLKPLIVDTVHDPNPVDNPKATDEKGSGDNSKANEGKASGHGQPANDEQKTGVEGLSLDWVHYNRLSSMLTDPIHDHGAAYEHNLKTCSKSTQDHRNLQQYDENHRIWEQYNPEKTRQARREWIHFLHSKYKEGKFKLTGKGRGVVYTAGNADTWHRLVKSIRILRHYGCKLPIQVFHFADELRNADGAILNELKSKDVSFKEIKQMVFDPSQWKNYQIKAEAIIESDFEDVLYMDSDNMVAQDPTQLFDSKQYKETGALFWPDFWKTHPANSIWRIINVDCRDELEQESGQILISKSMHLDALWLAQYFCLNYPVYFKMSGGDKDTFRFGMLALGKSWSGTQKSITLAGSSALTDRLHTMLQSDLHGKPMFVHANLLKYADVSRFSHGNVWGVFKRYEDDVYPFLYGSLKNPKSVGDGTRVIIHFSPLSTDIVPFSADKGSTRTEKIVVEDRSKYPIMVKFEDVFFESGGLS